MNILTIVVIIFILLESSNVLALYFNPTIKQANAVGMFKTWEDSKQYPQVHNMLKYLVYWVAGTKLIFIVLLIIIFMFADNTTKIYSVGALVLSIGSFYWKLYPIVREMDNKGQINPKGYSKILGIMIFVFMSVLTLSAIYAYTNL